MAEKDTHESLDDAQAELKRKLVWRIGFAGAMIGALLGALALFDYLSAPEEPASAPSPYTEPVPVPKKEVTQPVKPAEQPLVVPEEAPKPPPPPEVSAAPTEKRAVSPGAPARPEAAPPTAPRSPSAPETRPLTRPAAHPPEQRLPPAPQVVAPAPSAAPARPVEAKPAPAPSKPVEVKGAPAPAPAAPPAEEAAPVPRPQPAPPRLGGGALGMRLLSGYAVQAGVFSDVRRAEELHAKLTLNGIPSTIEARVQVGPFKTREEAEAAREKLKALGIEGVLLPPKGAKR